MTGLTDSPPRVDTNKDTLFETPSGMQQVTLQLWLACSLAICCLATARPARAQIAPDGTLPTNSAVSVEGKLYRITGGTKLDSNLFHSFDKFSVPTGTTAHFDSAPSIQHIFSRVTGGSVSNIDGQLKANANLFLLNPAGIIFGPNASLNISGSFVASTAHSVRFADGTEFSAKSPQTKPLLTVSVPVGLQFRGTAARILNQSQASPEEKTNSIEQPVGLQVPDGKTLALVGGDVVLEGGNLTAMGGRIELGSVAGTGEVSLTPTEKGWTLGYEGVQNFRDIQLSQRIADIHQIPSTVDVSGSGGGDIQVRGANVILTDGSQILATTLGPQPGGTLAVRAQESIQLIGATPDGALSSGLFAETKGAGHGAELRIKTEQLIIKDGAQASTTVLKEGTGRGGDLVVTARSIEMSGSLTYNEELYPSGLFTQTEGAGAAGNLTIQTGRMIVRNGAQASTSTLFHEGKGGDLSVKADEIELNGMGSGLFATSEQDASGEGGNLTVNTRQLIVQDEAQVNASTSGAGNAGNVIVHASDSVTVTGGNSGLFAQVEEEGTGGAGNLTIETERLILQDGAFVSGGRADKESSAVSGGTEPAKNRSNITIQVSDLRLLRNSTISTDAIGTAAGGNIRIKTDTLVALEDSDITASSVANQGGRVEIEARGIYPKGGSDITATSDLGPQFSGQVVLITPDIDPLQGLVELEEKPVDTDRRIAQGCEADETAQSSWFVNTGFGGLPASPGEPLSNLAFWDDVRPPQRGENRPKAGRAMPQAKQPAPHLVEATGWMWLPGSNQTVVVLTPDAPTVTPNSPWQTPANCYGK